MARNGLGAWCSRSTAAPGPASRSMQIVVVSRKLTSQPEVGGQRGPDDLLLDLAEQRDGDLLADVVLPDVDQRILLGELGQRRAQRAAVVRIARHDDRLQGRRGELVPFRLPARRADRVADLDLGQAPQLPDLPGRHRPAPGVRAVGEDADRGHLLCVARAGRVPGAHGAGEHADVGDLLARRAALDLEHPARSRAFGVPAGPRQQFGDPAHQRVHPRPGQRRPEEHRVHPAPPGLRGQFLAQPPVRDLGLAPDVRGHDRLVVLGEHLGQPGREGRVGAVPAGEASRARAQLMRRAHRDDGRRQPLGDIPQQALVTRAAPVDLVHEQHGRDAQPLQRPHQDAGLRLDALDGRDHQHRPVEHAQRAFHLGDEVRVARRVDQVDGHVADRERHDGRLDRDAALPFQRQRVGLGGAVIDAADLVDDPGRVQQPFGQGGLTGVYMRQDPQVQRSASHASYPPDR